VLAERQGGYNSGLCAASCRRPFPQERHPLANDSKASTALTFTGERFTPEVRGPIWYEHWHRYAFVAPLVRGLRVLDAACGEGYGSFLLARVAAQVTGIDISADAVSHARQRYPAENLAFAEGSVTALPLPDASVDVVVSFETIEHLTPQREMLAEFRRVLKSTGILVISSPNRPVYNETGAVENHFHVGELDRAELKALLDAAFPQQTWLAQRVIAQSALWSEDEGGRACRRRPCTSSSCALHSVLRCRRSPRSRCSTTGRRRCGTTMPAHWSANASSRGMNSMRAPSRRTVSRNS